MRSLSLKQTPKLAERNNRELQVATLTLERSRLLADKSGAARCAGFPRCSDCIKTRANILAWCSEAIPMCASLTSIKALRSL